MARSRGARTQLAAAFESVYGTPPGAGYHKMPFAQYKMSGEQVLLPNDDLLGFGRDPLPGDLDAQTTEGDVVVPLDVEGIGLWLKAVFGEPTTTGSAGEYTHVFSSGGWSLPSLSIEGGQPDVPHFEMSKGVKANTFSFDMERRGRPRATIGLIAQGSSKAGSTAAGTPTAYDFREFLNRHGSIAADGSALANVTAAKFAYTNNLDRVETIRADGLLDGLDESIAGLTVDLTLRFASATLLDAALAGTPVDLDLVFTRAADEHLTFSIPRLILPVPKREISGPNGISVTFAGIAAQQSGGGAMITATLVNPVATY